jgi:hypothetical protein
VGNNVALANRKEEYMETTPNGRVEVSGREEGKKKRSWGSAFFTFLASGGIILLLIAGVAIAVVVSILVS